MCIDMCIDMCNDMCIDMCIGMRVRLWSSCWNALVEVIDNCTSLKMCARCERCKYRQTDASVLCPRVGTLATQLGRIDLHNHLLAAALSLKCSAETFLVLGDDANVLRPEQSVRRSLQ